MNTSMFRRGFVGCALVALVPIALAAGDVNVGGTWNMKVQSSMGIATPVFVLTQKGHDVSGTYTGPMGSVPVTGSITGDALSMSYKVSTLEITYVGKVAGNTVSGEVKTTMLGSTRPIGKFTGARK